MWPLMEVLVEAKSELDGERLAVALSELAVGNPLFAFRADIESGQLIMGGVGEPHLDIKVHILRRAYKIDAHFGAPRVAYRETLGRKTEISHTHTKQTGGSGQFAQVKILFEPVEAGVGYSFENKIIGGPVPREFVPGVEKGLLQAKENGLLAGFPVIDFKATLVDGKYHDVDSSALAFEIAARAAFRELREKGAPMLIEPIMKVEVVTPDAYIGDVIGDLDRRRGRIQHTQTRGNAKVVTALVPLANMFGYDAALRGMSQGRARFTMRYDHYEAAPLMRPTPPDDRYLSDIGRRA